MDPITSALLNAGPIGLLAAVLFWAMRSGLDSLKGFHANLIEEMKADRASFRDELKAVKVEIAGLRDAIRGDAE